MLLSVKLTLTFVICLCCNLTFNYPTKTIETLKSIYMFESLFITSVAINNIDNKQDYLFFKN